MIELRDVYKIYGPRPADVLALARQGRGKADILAETGHAVALADVTLGMDAGKSFVVMGLSGSGKSTLIRHLNRLVDPTAGAVRVEGVDVGSLSGRALTEFRRRRTSMVFQRFGLFPHRTVLQNVAYGLTVQRVPRREWEARAGSWIETVGLSGYEGHFPAELSGGMQQRVGLARALCTDPDILLMDEPFSALDPLIRGEMQDQLLALQARLHKTIAFITHDLGEALKLGDRIAILKDGRVVQVGSPQEILLAPVDDYVRAFARNVDRGRVLTAEAVMADAVTLVVGQADLSATSRRLEQCASPVAYALDTSRRLLGVLPAGDVVAAARTPGATLNGSAREVPAASLRATLTDLLPMVFASRWPVPVVGDDGAFKGAVTRDAVVAALVAEASPGREQAGAGEPGPRAGG